MDIDVSVIIVNYNTCKLTVSCLDSIYSYTKELQFEVIVVDNASSDDSCDIIRREFPEVVLIESKTNLGFGKANNLGMNSAKGRYIFLLNSDTILKNNAIKIFYDYFENTKENVGTLGCILKDLNGNNIHSYGEFLTTKRLVLQYFKRLILHKRNPFLTPANVSDFIDVEYVTGADMFLPMEVFKRTSGFSPDFFMYFEEADWQKRMISLGLVNRIIAGPNIIHLEGGSDPSKSTQWAFRRILEFDKSSMIFMRRNSTILSYMLFRVINFFIKVPLILFYRDDSKRNKVNLIKNLLLF